MNERELKNASTLIARRNLTDKVVAVTVTWDEKTTNLTVIYYVDGKVGDDEVDLCDLTIGELLSEFTEARTGDCHCISTHESVDALRKLPNLAYVR